jgi:hypothetical protein
MAALLLVAVLAAGALRTLRTPNMLLDEEVCDAGVTGMQPSIVVSEEIAGADVLLCPDGTNVLSCGFNANGQARRAAFAAPTCAYRSITCVAQDATFGRLAYPSVRLNGCVFSSTTPVRGSAVCVSANALPVPTVQQAEGSSGSARVNCMPGTVAVSCAVRYAFQSYHVETATQFTPSAHPVDNSMGCACSSWPNAPITCQALCLPSTAFTTFKVMITGSQRGWVNATCPQGTTLLGCASDQVAQEGAPMALATDASTCSFYNYFGFTGYATCAAF